MTAKRVIFIKELRELCYGLINSRSEIDHFIENPSYFAKKLSFGSGHGKFV